MRQGKNYPKDTFKLRFDNINETVELYGRDNILCSEDLTKNGSQTSTKDKQSQIYQMKEM